jgi:hypothetical protein
VKTAPLRRSLAPAVVLSLLLAQLLAAHPGVFAGALAAGLDRGHELSLLRDAGHVDVVLHHDSQGDRAGTGEPGLDAHDGDHVVHLAASDAFREGARRIAAPLGALPAAAPIEPRPMAAILCSDPAVASVRSAALLRTVVLRV